MPSCVPAPGASTGTGRPAPGRPVLKRKKPQAKESKREHTRKSASGKAAIPPAYGLNIQELEAFFNIKNDIQKFKELIEPILESFTEFQQQFATAMTDRDEAGLGKLKHKMGMLTDIMALKELEALLEQCRSLIKENATQDQMDEAQQKVEATVAQITAALKKYLEQGK